MKTLKIALLSLAAFAAVGAHADEADGSQFAAQIESQRTRAEVQAEAATVSATRSFEPAGSRVLVPSVTTTERATVRAEAAAAVRAGKIPSGEAA